jgi:selenide,water dikinase
MSESVKLTQFSHGYGCGCKIAPAVLDEILKGNESHKDFPNLLVGNATRDDAAVLEIGNGFALISTTDFFMPIVDDPFDFGRIAATNAISDIYAMGGQPNLAIAILGWPIDKLAPEIAAKVIAGGRSICDVANIPLAGGHSIDSPEPIFWISRKWNYSIKKFTAKRYCSRGRSSFFNETFGCGNYHHCRKDGQGATRRYATCHQLHDYFK